MVAYRVEFLGEPPSDGADGWYYDPGDDPYGCPVHSYGVSGHALPLSSSRTMMVMTAAPMMIPASVCQSPAPMTCSRSLQPQSKSSLHGLRFMLYPQLPRT